MIHHYTSEPPNGDHFAAAPNAERTKVLLQLQEGGEQVRLALSPEQTEHLLELIQGALNSVREKTAAEHSQ